MCDMEMRIHPRVPKSLCLLGKNTRTLYHTCDGNVSSSRHTPALFCLQPQVDSIIKRSAFNSSLLFSKFSWNLTFLFLSLFYRNMGLVSIPFWWNGNLNSGGAGREGAQNFWISLCRHSKAGSVFPSFCALLPEHHLVICNIKWLPGL